LGKGRVIAILTYGIRDGNFLVIRMETAKKITIQVPSSLLQKAQSATKMGITPTIRQGLELVAAGRAYEKLRRMRGKVKFSINLKSLREDRL
jgi:hypothetical protein